MSNISKPLLSFAVFATIAVVAVQATGGLDGLDSASGPFDSSADTRKAPVEAEIVADAAAVAPGEKFTVGVLLRMEQDWHVYWRNPGEGGLETKLDVKAAEGFEVGPVQWPVPERFEQPGELVGFGYEGSVLLAVEIQAPDELPTDDPVSIVANVDYLACKDICLPGSAELAIALPVEEEPRSANQEMFSRWREGLPATGAAADAVARADVSGRIPPGKRTGVFELTLNWEGEPPEEVEFFPASVASLAVSRVQVQPGPWTRIRFAVMMLAGDGPRPTHLDVVVAYADAEQQRRAIGLTVPLAPRERPDDSEQPAEAE